MIAVCLAVHRPSPARLERQLASLDAQEGVEWALVREDDEPGSGAWSAFERCYARVGREAGLVAPCDQDDVWHPSKLATLSSALEGGAMLAFCDLRIVDDAGDVISPTYWTDRVATWDDLGHEERDVQGVVREVLSKLPNEHEIRAIDLKRELARRRGTAA